MAGVVSEAHLLAVRDRNPKARMRWLHWLPSHKPHQGLVARQLMTSPALTIQPDGTLAGAAHPFRRDHPWPDGLGPFLGGLWSLATAARAGE